MSQEHQKHINKFFPKKPILYQPGLASVLGSVNAGIMLCQLLFWHGKGKNKEGWIYKTVEEMKSETGLTRTQQENAIKKCVALNIFDYKRKGVPAKRHFRINMDTLENILPGLKKKAGIVYGNPPNKFAGNPQTITEITKETTSKNTKRKFNKNSASSIKDILASQGVPERAKSNHFGKKEGSDG